MLFSITNPFVFTVFGASGDLAKLKIFPTLYELMLQNRFPKEFYIVGFSRTKLTQVAFRKIFKESIEKKFGKDVNAKVLNALIKHVYYFSGQYSEIEDFNEFRLFLEKTTKKRKFEHIAYFSVPPVVFKDIVKNLGETRRSKKDDIRLIIEKPFGEDKKSAEELYHFVSQYFTEKQVYLLDHYLGKTSVQSILHLRRSNRILSHMLHGSEIANIQITAFEDIGVGDRIGYFEQVGTVRDMIQSHLLQILALITMNIPNHLDAESVQREKHAVLSAIDCPCDSENIVLGQYKHYSDKEGVPKNTRTETFAAVRLFLDQEDWYKVPIYLRTGKKLHEKHTYVVVELKKFPFQPKHEEPNRLIIELQPDERIHITLVNLHEDVQQQQEITTTDSIACSIEGCLPDHGTLLLEVIKGERLHFLSFHEIISAWTVVDQITSLSQKNKLRLHRYEHGSMGPKAQHTLPKKDGFSWYDIH
jgi:glucose-6-phosphate 1-dehydrogenase